MRSTTSQSSEIVDEPTPAPSSAVHAADDVPPHVRNDPFVLYMMDPPAEDIANVEALIEAGERYGQDHDRALADLLAGLHPLQRSGPAQR